VTDEELLAVQDWDADTPELTAEECEELAAWLAYITGEES